MGMTIEEAIKHAEEVAEEKRYEYQECSAIHDMENAMDCGKCAEEHEQLAEWLKDYKKLLGAIEDIKTDIHEYIGQCDNETWSYYIESKKEAYTDVLVLINKHTSRKEDV